MTTFHVFLIPFVGLLLVSFVYWLLGFVMEDEPRPLPNARFLVTQGRHTFQVDSEAEVVALAQSYNGVSRVERRSH